MKLRRFVLLTHRWLGLATSGVLSIVGVTGAVLVWPRPALFRKIAGPLHDRLLLGRVGWWIVVVATIAAVILQLGGLFLWWKGKRLSVRTRLGWRRAVDDLHHSAGAAGLLMLLLLAVTGVGMAFVTPSNNPKLRGVIFNLHTTRSFSTPVKVVYTIGTLGFLIQGVSGFVMWWKPK